MRAFRARLALLLVVAVLAAACGDDDSSETGTSETEAGEELTPIKVGILPLADLAPLFYGIEQGFFADEGLDVQTEIGPSGAAMTAAVTEGELQFSLGNYISLMLARQGGLSIQVVSHLASGAGSPEGGTQALLVEEGGEIQDVEDLAGRTFGVNALANISELAAHAVLDKHGVDRSDISFRELDWPLLNDAVLEGEVDVVVQAEPFVTFGRQAGLVSLLDPMYETLPLMPLGMLFASESWLEGNPELAEAFYRAFQRSLEAASDEGAMRDAIKQSTEIPPEAVDRMPLPNWQPEADRAALAELGELAVRYDILDEEPNLDELLWTAG